jgi:hypothetical protein
MLLMKPDKSWRGTYQFDKHLREILRDKFTGTKTRKHLKIDAA